MLKPSLDEPPALERPRTTRPELTGGPMRILFYSRGFHPVIGGDATEAMLLATGFAARGYDITVATATAGVEDGFPFKVVRRPGAARLLQLVRDADLVWHNCISLRALWPLAIFPRPLLVTHHIWFSDFDRGGRWLSAVKRLACRMGRNVFVSQALAGAARLPGAVIPNAYDDRVFRLMPDAPRDRDIAYVGRINRDKGVDLLIDALASLAAKGVQLRATVIGEGPAAAGLAARAAEAGISDLVAFVGAKREADLVRELNRHRLLVVPSRWQEPFGIVALEGAACGCVVIGTASGGLPEAVGPCGPIVPKDDAASLAEAIGRLIADPALMASYRQAAPAHLARHRPAAMVDAYERLIADMGRRRGNRHSAGIDGPFGQQASRDAAAKIDARLQQTIGMSRPEVDAAAVALR